MTTLAIHRQLPGRSTPYSMADHRSGRCGRQLGEADLRSHRPLGDLSRESVSAMAILRQSSLTAGITASCSSMGPSYSGRIPTSRASFISLEDGPTQNPVTLGSRPKKRARDNGGEDWKCDPKHRAADLTLPVRSGNQSRGRSGCNEDFPHLVPLSFVSAR
jgi:hypothetical protein